METTIMGDVGTTTRVHSSFFANQRPEKGKAILRNLEHADPMVYGLFSKM